MIRESDYAGLGYEGLISGGSPVAVEGVRMIIDTAKDLLERIWKQRTLAQRFPKAVTLKDGRSATVRPVHTDDGEALTEFYAGIPVEDYRFYCPHPLDREHALAKVARADDPGFVCLVLEDQDKRIGGYGWYQWTPGSPSSVFGACLLREFQGCRAGATLMSCLLDEARVYGPGMMTLTVQKANPAAVHLYAKMGFVIVGEGVRKRDNEPQYRMQLLLSVQADSKA